MNGKQSQCGIFHPKEYQSADAWTHWITLYYLQITFYRDIEAYYDVMTIFVREILASFLKAEVLFSVEKKI